MLSLDKARKELEAKQKEIKFLEGFPKLESVLRQGPDSVEMSEHTLIAMAGNTQYRLTVNSCNEMFHLEITEQ